MAKRRTVWCVADTHFFHKAICKYEGRPENFNEILIANWNALVGDDDLVIHLGDVIFAGGEKLIWVNSQLKGRKVLVKGNHDNNTNEWYMDHGFMFACDGFRWDHVWFTHEPAKFLPDGCTLNVHGHLHRTGWKVDELGKPLQSWHRLVEIEQTLSPKLLMQII